MNKENTSPELGRRKARFAALAASYNDWEDDSYRSKETKEIDVSKNVPKDGSEKFVYSNKVLYERPGSRSNTPKKKREADNCKNTPHKYLPPQECSTNLTKIPKSKLIDSIYPHLDSLEDIKKDEEKSQISNAILTPHVDYIKNQEVRKCETPKGEMFDLSVKSEEDFKLTKESPSTIVIEFKKPISSQIPLTPKKNEPASNKSSSGKSVVIDESLKGGDREARLHTNKKTVLTDERDIVSRAKLFSKSVQSIMNDEIIVGDVGGEKVRIRGKDRDKRYQKILDYGDKCEDLDVGASASKGTIEGCKLEPSEDTLFGKQCDSIHRKPTLPKFQAIELSPSTLKRNAIQSEEWTTVMDKFKPGAEDEMARDTYLKPDELASAAKGSSHSPKGNCDGIKEQAIRDKDSPYPVELSAISDPEIYHGDDDVSYDSTSLESNILASVDVGLPNSSDAFRDILGIAPVTLKKILVDEERDERYGGFNSEEDLEAMSDRIFMEIKAQRQRDIESLSSYGIVSSLKKDVYGHQGTGTDDRTKPNNSWKDDVKTPSDNPSKRQAEMEALVKRWEKVSTSPNTHRKLISHQASGHTAVPTTNREVRENRDHGTANPKLISNASGVGVLPSGGSFPQTNLIRDDGTVTSCEEGMEDLPPDADVHAPGDLSIMLSGNDLDLSLRLSDFNAISQKFALPPLSCPPSPPVSSAHETRQQPRTDEEHVEAKNKPQPEVNGGGIPKPRPITPNIQINKIITYDHPCTENVDARGKKALRPDSPCNHNHVSAGTEKGNLTYADKIKELTKEVEHQQTVISQVSQALMICRQQRKNAFHGSQEQIEAEKLNFIARQKRQMLLSEVHRLREEEKVEITKMEKCVAKRCHSYAANFSPLIKMDPTNLANGFLNISNIRLMLKPEFLETKINQGFVYHFLCVFKYATNLVFTQLATYDTTCHSAGSNHKKNAININNCINIHGVKDDWKVELEIYSLYIRKEGKEYASNIASAAAATTPSSHYSLFSSSPCKSKPTPTSSSSHMTAGQSLMSKLTPHKKKVQQQMTPKVSQIDPTNPNSKNIISSSNLLSAKNLTSSPRSPGSTSNLGHHMCGGGVVKNESVSQLPLYTNDQSNYSDAGVFVLSGFTSVTRSDAQNRNRVFALKKVPQSSPLQGNVMLNLKCHAQINTRGFLTMFEVLGGLGSWDRRWFVLAGQYLSYWKYPEHETTKAPMNSIDLSVCVNRLIEPVHIEVCAKPNTLALDILDQGACDRSMMPGAGEERYSAQRYLLSADNKEQLSNWCQMLNKALSYVNTWERNYPKNNFGTLMSTV